MRQALGILLVLALVLTCPAAWAQNTGRGEGVSERELHLNTIGAFSAGLVLQAYGYIGLLADALSRGVYEPRMVSEMLAETTSYLRNVSAQLQKYPPEYLAGPDRRFIASMVEILNLLISEAEALSAFAQSKSKADLDKYEKARDQALERIDRIFQI